MVVNGRRRSPFLVVVTEHARERARERHPGFKCARIVDEVHEALLDGRVSATKPAGFGKLTHPEGLYAWTADGARCYGLRPVEDAFVVITTIAPIPSLITS